MIYLLLSTCLTTLKTSQRNSQASLQKSTIQPLGYLFVVGTFFTLALSFTLTRQRFNHQSYDMYLTPSLRFSNSFKDHFLDIYEEY